MTTAAFDPPPRIPATGHWLYEPVAKRSQVAIQLLMFMGWIAVTGIGAWLKPSPDLHGTHQELGFPPCPCAMFLDRPCPGCGLTTSWSALIHGNLSMAFAANACGPLLYLCFTALSVIALIGFVLRRRLRTDARWFQRVATTVFWVFVIYGVARFAVTPHYATQYERMLIGRNK
jgi:hypothetical protein